MGTACSQSVVVVGNTLGSSSRSSTPITSCSTTGNVVKSLADSTIWSPFRVTKLEAEELLAEAEPGAYVFSHDIASEYFLSICAGKYVCHHSVVPREHAYYVGARKFSTISEVIDFFKDHPLGETLLTEEYRPEPSYTAQVQLKPETNNQITIVSSPLTPQRPIKTTEKYDVVAKKYENQHFEQTKSTYLTNDFYDKETGKINFVLYQTIKEETPENEIINSKPALEVPRHQALSVPRHMLKRESAIDNVSSSSSERDMGVPDASGLSPLLCRKTNRY